MRSGVSAGSGGSAIDNIFLRGHSAGYRLFFVFILSLVIFFFQARESAWLAKVRLGLEYVVVPIVYFAQMPGTVNDWAQDTFQSRESLAVENKRLAQEHLLLSRKVQQMAALIEENNRLRSLLLSSETLDDNVLIAEVVGVDNDPYRHEIILDRGQVDKIDVGLAVIDQTGLMGQIIHVGPYTARALLISDESHATPVQVSRNGVRAIAVGTGALDKLRLIHVPDTADLQVGDLLVSSGLGGRFPPGYPVGHITYIENDPGQPFARIEAKPASYLDRRMHVLIVQPQLRSSAQEDAAVAKPAGEAG